jgi:hypothetical protein
MSAPLVVHVRLANWVKLLITCLILKQQGMWKCLAFHVRLCHAFGNIVSTDVITPANHVARLGDINAEKYFGRKKT